MLFRLTIESQFFDLKKQLELFFGSRFVFKALPFFEKGWHLQVIEHSVSIPVNESQALERMIIIRWKKSMEMVFRI